MSERNTLDFALLHDVIAALFQEIDQCSLVVGFDMDHLSVLPKIWLILYEPKSGLWEHDEGFVEVVGEVFLALGLCLLIQISLDVSLLYRCILQSLRLPSRILSLLRSVHRLFLCCLLGRECIHVFLARIQL